MTNANLNQPTKKTVDIAIVGMASHFPDAVSLYDFWTNIVNKKDSITDIDAMDGDEYWRKEDFFDADPSAVDKSYGYKAGFVPPIEFDPIEFKLPPLMLDSISTAQLFALHVAKQAMLDARLIGPNKINVDLDRVGVILGGAGNGNTSFSLAARQQAPYLKTIMMNSGLSAMVADDIVERVKGLYLEWNEDSFPGFLGNVACGRIASYFDLGGTSYMVDAACASSLAAIKGSIGELVDGSCDAVLTGGVNLENSIFSFLCFSKTPALSRSNISRPFDENSDGIMLGDGVGFLVLKRLDDARRDGDRIYATIKSLSASSDGRAKSIFAPRFEGQIKALERTYERAGLTPADIQLLEAHGTGTQSGDHTEIKSLKAVFDQYAIPEASIALGSIKSQIGHTRCAAGAASMMKVALGLYHKILPPTINVKKPSQKLALEGGPFYINTEARPWIKPANGKPRRAALSAFGFGGTNFHAILEEYTVEPEGRYRLRKQPEVVVFHASDPAELLKLCQSKLSAFRDSEAQFRLHQQEQSFKAIPETAARLAFASQSTEQTVSLLAEAVKQLQVKPNADWEHPHGIYYKVCAQSLTGKIVALFPGQGSQYVNMARDLAIDFPEMRRVLESLDAVANGSALPTLSDSIYPVPAFSADAIEQQTRRLTSTSKAQPAIGAISAGYFRILQGMGFKPDFVAGHSYGEVTALWAAGVLSDENFYKVSLARGQAMEAPTGSKGNDAGAMLAASLSEVEMKEALSLFPCIIVANYNSHEQLVFGGATDAIKKLHEHLVSKKVRSQILPVSGAFHTTFVHHAHLPFKNSLADIPFVPPSCALFSTSSSHRHSDHPDEIKEALASQLISPVYFKQTIESIHNEGGYLYVEIGPKGILGKLVTDILKGKKHSVISLNPSANGEEALQFRRALAKLVVEGVKLNDLDSYAAQLPAADEKKKNKTYTLRGGFFFSDKSKQRREHALRVDTRSMGGFLKEKWKNEEPKPVQAQEAPVTQSLTTMVGANPERSTDFVKYSSGDSSMKELIGIEAMRDRKDGLLSVLDSQIHAQNMLSQVHKQFQSNQKDYIQFLNALMANQYSLLEKFQGSDQIKDVVHSLGQSFQLLDKNQELYHINHERYFDNQQTLLGGRTAHENGSAVQVAQRSPLNLARAPVTLPEPARSQLNAPASVIGDHSPLPAALQSRTVGEQPRESTVPVRLETVTAPKPSLPEITAAVKSSEIKLASSVPVLSAADVAMIQRFEGLTEASLVAQLIVIVSDRTGYPQDMILQDMDLEADLGIDSIKRLEIFGAMFEKLGVDPNSFKDAEDGKDLETVDVDMLGSIGKMAGFFKETADKLLAVLKGVGAAPAATPTTPTVSAASSSALAISAVDAALMQRFEGLTEASLVAQLIAIVSDRTGYPQDMILPDMDLEADLGIDSIKRLEIFGAMFEKLGVDPNSFKDAEEGKDLETVDVDMLGSIGKMASFFKEMADKLLVEYKGTSAVPGTAPTPPSAGPGTATAETYQNESSASDSVAVAALYSLGFVSSTKKSVTGASGSTQKIVDAETQKGATPARRLHMDDTPFAQNAGRYLACRKKLVRPDQVELSMSPGRIWLLTDDGKGLCDEIAKLLLSQGQKVVRLQLQWQLVKGARKSLSGVPDYVVPGCEENSIKDLISRIETTDGQIGGFLHIGAPSVNIKSLSRAFNKNDYETTQAVFTFAKLLQPRLTSPSGGRAYFFVVSQHDGELGLAGNAPIVTSGLTGLTKSLSIEWDRAFCRTVDIDPKCNKVLAANIVLEELRDSATALAEVGRSDTGDRMTITLAPSDLDKETELSRMLPDEKSVFLVTGGARGITAECVIALAKRSHATFALLGRTDINTAIPSWAAGAVGLSSLKANAIKRLQIEGEVPTPVKVERMVKDPLQIAEVKETLKRIEQAGAKALYLSCDISNADDVARVVGEIEKTAGCINGVIHGAGNLADNRIEKKLDSDFFSVFHTKVKGLENVLNAVKPEALQTLVLFSSVSGFFGNAGQTDYAMANEVLNKFAYLFQALHPDSLVRAINWGPWDGGMVNETLKKAYAERNLVIIPKDRGIEFFVDEFRFKGAPQVIIGGDNYKAARKIKALHGPVTVRREIKPELNHFLNDHVIDGHPVLPATAAASWMVKLCEDLLPGYHLEKLSNLRVLKGLVFNSQGAITLYAELTPHLANANRGDRHEIAVRIFTKSAGREQNRYQAVVVMSREKVAASKYLSAKLEASANITVPIYGDLKQGRLLFHGPAFQGIRTILNFDASRLTSACRLDVVDETRQGQFMANSFNAFLVDVYLQVPFVWLMLKSEFGGLPSVIGSIEQFNRLSFGQAFYLSMEVRSQTAFTLSTDIYVHDEAGSLYAKLSDVCFTISEELRNVVLGSEVATEV